MNSGQGDGQNRARRGRPRSGQNSDGAEYSLSGATFPPCPPKGGCAAGVTADTPPRPPTARWFFRMKSMRLSQRFWPIITCAQSG
ncbi:MAG: hypothetical protein ACE5EY_03570 [Anaerolineae bacterium]